MSLKDLFSKISVAKSLTNSSEESIASNVESVSYHEADIIHEKRFIPPVDYSKPETFARYGSAKKYYGDAIRNIYKTYPYDGSLYERIDWQNSSSYAAIYVLENEYPRTNGYINFSYGDWGDLAAEGIVDGYGLPDDLEYISLYGGAHAKNTTPRSVGGNIWAPTNNRESNLELDLTEGTSVEFWLKKDEFDVTKSPKEVVFDLWNYANSSSADYGRFRIDLTGSTDGDDPFKVTLMSGTAGFVTASVCASTFTAANVADGAWHHYAFTFKSASVGVTSRFYVDGDLNNETTLTNDDGTDRSINKVSGSMMAYIGALRTAPSGTTTPHTAKVGAGKLSGSLDEFRYWKTQRSSKDIGRYWFTHVGGGANTDLANTDLGVYYKFNEGIMGNSSRDLTILDYSGRVTNGSWYRDATYASAIRNTGSAIVSASAANVEFKDPIMYPDHSDVQTVLIGLENTGSVYDYNNNSSLFNMFPSWMQEEDGKGGNELLDLTQIVATYFDSLHLQIENVSSIKDFAYVSGSDKPNVFSNRLLEGRGLLAPEIFIDADILEKLADRSEDKLFVKSLNDIKNTIYQNIYNNLIHIYKSKGTEKSFRNLIRCFGIDEEVIRLSLYGDNIEYELRESTTMAESRDRLIDFNHTDRFSSVVFSNSSSADSNSVSYITGSTKLSEGYAFTLETEVLFPKKFSQGSEHYATQNFTDLSSSIFGVHTAVDDETDATTWNPFDRTNFQVYAVRSVSGDDDARFILSASGPPVAGGIGGAITGSVLESSIFSNVYDNSKWSLAVRVRPDTYPEMSFVTGSDATTHNWIVDFYGVQYEADVIVNEFTVSGTLLRSDFDAGFVTGSKRVYVGAHTENFTGSIITRSDVKVAACRYWLDYLENDTIKAHARDVKNYGAMHPYRNAYLFQNDLRVEENRTEVPQIETLALNWDFEQVTGSDASGEFVVADFSSGSTALQTSRYGFLGNILKAQHTARGYGFPASSGKVVDVDYFVSAKQNLPENLYAQDMIKILTTQDDLEFTRESRPITFFFAFEKSMYQSISEEALNMFGSIVDFNNLIGEPVNKYRPQYKRLAKLRQLFFERVGNTPDLDKYVEFYKWFDTSLGKMIEQLIPASADFADGIQVMVENHLLARDKYQHKFPTLEMKAKDPAGAIGTVLPFIDDKAPGSCLESAKYSPGWKFVHHPTNNLENTNVEWWRYRADRYKEYTGQSIDEFGIVTALENPISSSAEERDGVEIAPGINRARSMILETMRSTRNRQKSTPYRFSVKRSCVIRQGINYPLQKERDIVYHATSPAGPLAPPNVPANVMLALGEDVEKRRDIKDNSSRYPNSKKRYGFRLDIAPNKDMDYSDVDGNIAAPFSLYSSSVNTGYNLQIVNRFTGSVELTNLHTDVYGPDYETPMQGPFPEKFVGGREHRHIEINKYDSTKEGPNNLDSVADRPEGFKLMLGLWQNSRLVTCTTDPTPPSSPGALGIVDPQYPDADSPAVRPPYLFDRPKANLRRVEGAKRPVNVKNILMTTSSLKQSISGALMHGRLGNYQKTYQVVQTAGRSINDPFFRDQSHSFALYPETLATYGRKPFQGVVGNLNSVELNKGGSPSGENPQNVQMAGGTTGAEWDDQIGGYDTAAKPYSIAIWVRPAVDVATWTPLNGSNIWSFGGLSSGGYRKLQLGHGPAGTSGSAPLVVNQTGIYGQNFVKSTVELSGAVWYHVVVTYAGGAAGDLKIYVDGTDTSTAAAATDGPRAIDYPGFVGGFNSSTYFVGHVCDFAVWKEELNDRAVQRIYNQGLRRDPRLVSPESMVSYYPLGMAAGDQVTAANVSSPTGEGALHDLFDIRQAGIGGVDNTSTAVPIQLESPPGLTNISGTLNYLLPDRTGANSNDAIFVNRFSAPGSYEVLSRGYMDPAHEEKSVYNALPYRNRGVIDYGRSGSSDDDPTLTGPSNESLTIYPINYDVGKARGLNQLSTLRSGRFGVDAAYGSISQLSYSTRPAWHKVNRNPKRVIKEAPTMAGFFNASGSLLDIAKASSVQIGTPSTWDATIGGAGGDALPFTISAWVNPRSYGISDAGLDREGNVMNFGDGDRGIRYYGVRIPLGSLMVEVSGTTSMGNSRTSNGAVPLNTWTHVVATFAGGSGVSPRYIC